MSENKKGAGRPAEPKLIQVTAEQLVFTPNVRFKHLHATTGYSPLDFSLYGDSLDRMYEANIKQHHEENPDKVFRFISAPIVVEVDGKYEVQVGNSRCLTMLKHAPTLPFIVELRSKEMSEEDKMAENTSRTDMSDLAIAYTIVNSKGTARRAAMLKAGWSQVRVEQWSYILENIMPDYLLLLEQKAIGMSNALDIARQTKQVQGLMLPYMQEDDDLSPYRCMYKVGMSIDDDSALLTEEPIIDQPFAISYDNGFKLSWFYMRSEEDAYCTWYQERKNKICSKWGKSTAQVESHYGYHGPEARSDKKAEFMPYDGKGRAYWYKDTIVSVVDEKAKNLVEKVEKVKARLATQEAMSYADKKVREEAGNMVSRKTDLTELCKIMAASLFMPYLSNENTIQRYLAFRTSSMHEDVIKMIMPEYEDRMQVHVEAYMDDKGDKLNEVQSKLDEGFNAAIDVHFPTSVHYIDYDNIAESVIAVKTLPVAAKEKLKVDARKMGVSVQFKEVEAEVKRIAKAVKRFMATNEVKFTEMFDARYAAFEEKEAGVFGMAEDIKCYVFQGEHRLPNYIIGWFWKDNLAKAWRKYIDTHYPRAVQLKWSAYDVKDVAKLCGEDAAVAPNGDWLCKQLAMWLISVGVEQVNTTPIIIDPMPKTKVQAQETEDDEEEMCSCGEMLAIDCECDEEEEEDYIYEEEDEQ